MNALPSLDNPFPLLSAFDFQIDPLASGANKEVMPFVFGNGDMGQHGLGVDVLGEIKRPRSHKWFEEHVGLAKKGEEGGEGWKDGVKQIVAGGMHTLAIDGLGRVSQSFRRGEGAGMGAQKLTFFCFVSCSRRSGHGGTAISSFSSPFLFPFRPDSSPDSRSSPLFRINDNAALGRPTDLPNIESEVLETQPMPVQFVKADEDFRAVRVAAGDSVSLAVGETGEVRCWGSFRVRFEFHSFSLRGSITWIPLTDVS